MIVTCGRRGAELVLHMNAQGQGHIANLHRALPVAPLWGLDRQFWLCLDLLNILPHCVCHGAQCNYCKRWLQALCTVT